MALKLNQRLAQTQNLLMTPQLQQAIKMLTLTHMEMTKVISEEMVENPMLEESGSTGAKENESAAESDYNVERLEMQNQEAKSENFNEPTSIQKDDFDFSSYIESYNSNQYTPPNMAGGSGENDITPYDNIASKGQTLAEHLEWQLRMEELSKTEWLLADEVIHNINNDGYLEVQFEDLIANSKLSREAANEILLMIQRLDPVGCGAHNLEECLLAQAKIAEERSPLVELMIRNHLKDLQNKDHNKIAKVTGASLDNIKLAEEAIQNFHPRPGRLVASEDTHYVVPDIFVQQVGDEFVVQVNDEGVPRLRVSKLYEDMLKKKDNKEVQNYVNEKLRQALWLIKSVQNRQKTITKVAKAIVRQQQVFFKKGPSFMRPMILKDIANEIGMHESTVSRVTTNKFMHTPIGVFELKYFFNAGVGGNNGGIDITSEGLNIKLKELISNENPLKPLSDQKLADLLSEDAVKVARRTIAKYREALDIPSSSKRKQRV